MRLHKLSDMKKLKVEINRLLSSYIVNNNSDLENFSINIDEELNIKFRENYHKDRFEIDKISIERKIDKNKKKIIIDGYKNHGLMHLFYQDYVEKILDFKKSLSEKRDTEKEKEIKNKIEEHEKLLKDFQRFCTIEDIKIVFENMVDINNNKNLVGKDKDLLIKDILVDSWEKWISLERMFQKWTKLSNNYIKDKREISILYDDFNKILVCSEHEKDRNSKGYIIEENNNTFDIHRINNNKRINNKYKGWTETEVNQLLGFDKCMKNINKVKDGTSYRLFDEIIITPRSEQVFENFIKKEEELQKFKEAKGGKYSLFEEVFGCSRVPNLLNINGEIPSIYDHNLNTKQIKELQEKLNIKEERVRKRFNKKDDWERLSYKRRARLLEKIILEDIIEWYEDNIEEQDKNYYNEKEDVLIVRGKNENYKIEDVIKINDVHEDLKLKNSKSMLFKTKKGNKISHLELEDNKVYEISKFEKHRYK